MHLGRSSKRKVGASAGRVAARLRGVMGKVGRISGARQVHPTDLVRAGQMQQSPIHFACNGQPGLVLSSGQEVLARRVALIAVRSYIQGEMAGPGPICGPLRVGWSKVVPTKVARIAISIRTGLSIEVSRLPARPPVPKIGLCFAVEASLTFFSPFI